MPITSTVDIEDIVRRVRSVVGEHSREVLLHRPEFGENESRYVQQCIETGWVSSAGRFVNEFERLICSVTGARHAIAMVNGTAALHVAMLLAGVEPDTEVIMPSLTFVATANAAAYCGAIPHFCDVSPATLGVDAVVLRQYLDATAGRRDIGCFNRLTGRRIAAIVPMHTFGHSVEMNALIDVARDWHIPIVEDAAESLGSYYRGTHTGTFGLLGVLSFNGNKIVTAGAGGAILTNDDALAHRARHISTTAKVPHRWDYVHDEVGYNYRMPNLNAALGFAQLERLADFVDRKRKLASKYQQAFADAQGVSVFVEPENCRSNYWLNAILLAAPDAENRDELLGALNDAQLQSRPAWKPMHELPMYLNCPRMELNVTSDLARRIVNVPSSAGLVDSEIR